MTYSGHVSGRGTKSGVSWGYVIEVGGDLATGRRARKTRRGFTTKREAEAALRGELVELESGSRVDRSLITVGDFLLGEWLSNHARVVRGNTVDSYRSAIECHIVPHIGVMRLQQVGPRDINQLYAILADRGSRSGGPLAPKTIRNAHVVLRRAFGDAVRWGLLRDNPAASASPPSTSVGPKVQDPWQPHEVRAFLSVVEGDEREALWRLAGTTGMRRSEILGIRWSDVNLEAGWLAITQTVVLQRGNPVIGSPKTRRSARRVYLDDRTIAVLADLRSHANETARQLVFAHPDGGPLRPDRVTNQFRRICEQAGLRRIRLHDLRHTWATIALQEGVNPKVVSEQLGHASISITLDTYSHVIPSLQADAVTRVSDAIHSADSPPLPPPSRLRVVS
ncbi:MAG: tyrosine-type recombinase/integrase [Acidimicrobiia bacterium]